MAIYIYDEHNEHPQGYRGVRVVVSVGTKKKQKYFTFGRHGIPTEKKQVLIEKAKELESDWLAEQKRWQEKEKRHGSSMIIKRSPMSAKGMSLIRPSKHYKKPRIRLTVKTDGKTFTQAFSFTDKKEFEAAYLRAAKSLDDNGGLDFKRSIILRPDWYKVYSYLYARKAGKVSS